MPDSTETKPSRVLHGSVAAVILLLAALYTWAAMMDRIKTRIDPVNLAIIVLAVLFAFGVLNRGFFDRLQDFEIPWLKLRMLERAQQQQRLQLDEFRMILPVLLPETERKHLVNLASGRTEDYRGNHIMRSEMRRLRSIGLIECQRDRHIGDMKDGSVVDVSKFVRLTSLGAHWADRIREFDREASGQKDRTAASAAPGASDVTES